ILTDREAIRQWAAARGGNPILMDIPDGTQNRTVLQRTFGQHALNSDGSEGPDRVGGFHLVSWEAWFVALEEGGLALKISDDPAGGNEAEFEFVSRQGGGQTTGAAQKPASIVTEGSDPANR